MGGMEVEGKIESYLKPFRRRVQFKELIVKKQELVESYLRPESVSDAALLIVDMQKGFLEKGAAIELPQGRDCIPRIKRLLETAHEVGALVVFAKYVFSYDPKSPSLPELPFTPEVFPAKPGQPTGPGHPSSCCLEGDPSVEIVDALKPKPNDVVIRKRGYDAFFETPLDSILRVRGIKYLYVCGVAADVCVDSSIRSALHRQYRVTAISDAVAATSSEAQEVFLDIWSKKFARIKSTEEVLAELANLR